MGTTATNLHILAAAMPDSSRLADDIVRAYRKLGYARPKKPGGGGTKRVVLAPDASGDWLSIYDSENDRIDTGELKQLAVEITRKLGTAALLTSLYDSDSFEFVMFHNGKQVDAAVSDPESHAGGLKMLKGNRRAQAWYSMFIGRDLRRAIMAGQPRKLLEGWAERLKVSPASTSPFAEDALGAWCRLAGLSPENTTMISEELIARPGQTALTTLILERTASKQPKPRAAPAGTTLAYYRSDDDCPYLRFFPAPWPRHPGVSDKEQWAILCSGGGVSGLHLQISVEGPAPVRIERVYLRALPFYNGQLTSLTSIAAHEWISPDAGAVCPPELVIEIPDFVVPAADPESRRLVMILLVIQATLEEAGEATIAPSVTTATGIPVQPPLPPLRLRALRPEWVPLVSRSAEPKPIREPVLRLNTPSVWSGVAILPSDDGAARERAQALSETWLAQLSPEAGTMAVVHTLKHMSPSFNISKATKTLPFAELTHDKLWRRLFDEGADYQTVTIGLCRPDAAHPHAGVTIQAALHGLGEIFGKATLTCAIWLIDHEDIARRIGSSADAAAELFERWIETVEPVQGWIARATWIPEFTTYEDFMQTVYESTVVREWHRADRAPPMPWLRFVAPKLWLNDSFVELLDQGQLETAAEISRRGHVTELSLRKGRSLAELETALEPILPRFHGNHFPRE